MAKQANINIHRKHDELTAGVAQAKCHGTKGSGFRQWSYQPCIAWYNLKDKDVLEPGEPAGKYKEKEQLLYQCQHSADK